MTKKTTATSAFKIENSNGMDGPVWRRTYRTASEAAEAIRRAYGWDHVVMSSTYTVSNGDACSAYATQEECDADETGAHAPRICRQS
jgi:hypothetical protein